MNQKMLRLKKPETAGEARKIISPTAGMPGSELGTKLTGRHLDRELLPFSYTEYLTFRGFLEKSAAFPADAPSFLSYLAQGGFPEYLELNDEEILFRLFDDILYRDIAVRYGIRDTSALKRLALFLLSNTGNPVTANRLTGAMGIKSASTVLDYFSCRQLRILYHHPILHTQPDESICLKNNSIHNPSIISSYFQGCNYC